MLFAVLFLLSFVWSASAVNFDWEKIQLTEAETQNYAAIRFGDSVTASSQRDCKIIPGDEDWPADTEWAKFNKTLGGALLKPLPLASVCYEGPQYDAARCQQLQRTWTSMNLHSNHPISVMSQWSSGSSCVPTSDPTSNCTQGGYPVYVVNATTARHVQLAVNFARNQNIRLTIKNSGHDFNGKSIGGNSLSVWVHNLKGYQFYENYTTPSYIGRAVAYGGGFQAQETAAVNQRHNITIISAGGPTVGIAGGFLQTGGHSSFTSYYGLAADHVLSIQAVTADGKLVTASEIENSDLFWAFRGGGGGTYGIVTSAVVKAFPRTPLASASITFSTIPQRGTNQTGISLETFWDGMRAHWRFAKSIVDAGGLGYNFIRHVRSGNTTGLEYTTSISLPGKIAAEARAFVRPHLEELNELGIPVPPPSAQVVKRFENFDVHDNPFNDAHDFAKRQTENGAARLTNRAIGDDVGNTLIASRLFEQHNWATESALEEMHLAIREMVDVDKGGYTFHGMNYGPSLNVSGNPNNAVNPAFRRTLMHAQAYEADAWWDTTSAQKSIAEQKARHDRLQSYMDKWKAITPRGGSYHNEGDSQEPDWKQAFYGSHYPKLANIKRKWDPLGVFWAISAVRSDEWEVRGSSGGGRKGVFTQDGRLCRV